MNKMTTRICSDRTQDYMRQVSALCRKVQQTTASKYATNDVDKFLSTDKASQEDMPCRLQLIIRTQCS